MNTLGAISRGGQWRFRRIFRATDALGRIDLSDDGLIDFSACSEVALEVTPRASQRAWRCDAEPELEASLAAGTLFISNPGIVEAVFPEGSLLCLAPGLYDVRVFVTIGAEKTEMLNEPIEFS